MKKSFKLFICLFLIFIIGCSNELNEVNSESYFSCVNECEKNICNSNNEFIKCDIKSNGCKVKENQGKILGKCDIQCLENTDCENNEICKNNKCNKKSNNLIDFNSNNIYQPIIENNKSINNKKSQIRKFEWNYNNKTYNLNFEINSETYNFFKNRDRIRDFDLFVSDSFSKDFIASLTNELKIYAKNNNIPDEQIPHFVISFVQHLPYTSDSITTGFDEYPRFPYETLYDNGGDCEDTSILVSSILNELGYGTALLIFNEHVAVGIKCEPDYYQAYYEIENVKYCYLETTNVNWEIGSIPEEYENEIAEIIPIQNRAELKINFTYSYEYNNLDTYVDVNIDIHNVGSKVADSTFIYIALLTSDEDFVWDSIESKKIKINPEEIYEYKVTNLHAPSGENFKVYVRAFGDNVISDEVTGEWIVWS